MSDLTFLWGGQPFDAELPDGVVSTAAEQLAQAMREAGIDPPPDIRLDGKLRRFSTGEKRDKSGWYVAFGDGIPAGAFGDWRTGVHQTWVAHLERELTPEEIALHRQRMAEIQAIREAEIQAQRAAAVSAIQSIWEAAQPAPPDHPYLTRKRVKPHNARVTSDGRLVIPLYDSEGQLASLQYISADGQKLFHPGAPVKGCLGGVGNFDAAGKTVFVAEGFATAASVTEVSGCPCLIAFSAQNIPAVVATAKRVLPGRRIVVVADNDLSGVGQRVAEYCAQQYGVQVVIPPVAGQDANDYLLAGGDLAALLQPRSDWLVPFDEFAKPVPPAPYLVKGWLYQRQLALLVGPAGKGKTFLALDWALSVATGRTWHGQRVHRASVLYLAGEAHESLRRRALAWKQFHGVQSLGHSFLSLFGRDLNSPGGYEQVVEHCEIVGLEPQLIVIDTLHRAFRGNENSAEDTRTMLDVCDRLVRHFGAAVLLVHHTGWSEQAQERGRGSSAWRAGVDTEILLIPQESNDCLFQIVQTKSRDAMPSPPLCFRLQPVEIEGWEDEDGEPVVSAVPVIAEAPEGQKKKDKKDRLEAHVETIESAWWATGEQVVDGAPFIPRNALRQYLIEQRGLSPDSADVYLRPSSKGKLIAELTAAKVVEAVQDNAGWRIVDTGLAASLLLRKAGDRIR
jgi:phage/plasmid primase-like uncharacterized protein